MNVYKTLLTLEQDLEATLNKMAAEGWSLVNVLRSAGGSMLVVLSKENTGVVTLQERAAQRGIPVKRR